MRAEIQSLAVKIKGISFLWVVLWKMCVNCTCLQCPARTRLLPRQEWRERYAASPSHPSPKMSYVLTRPMASVAMEKASALTCTVMCVTCVGELCYTPRMPLPGINIYRYHIQHGCWRLLILSWGLITNSHWDRWTAFLLGCFRYRRKNSLLFPAGVMWRTNWAFILAPCHCNVGSQKSPGPFHSIIFLFWHPGPNYYKNLSSYRSTTSRNRTPIILAEKKNYYKNLNPIAFSGVHASAQGRHGAVVCRAALQGEVLWHLHGGGLGEEPPRTAQVWHPLLLLPRVLLGVHPQVALSQAVWEQDCQVWCWRMLPCVGLEW